MTLSHDDAWLDLPWYAAGTLPAEERPAIERHLATCERCRRELDHQRRLVPAVRAIEPDTVAVHASWAQIEARIGTWSGPGPIGRAVQRIRTSEVLPLRLAGGVAATVAAVSFGAWTLRPASYVTLTGPSVAVAEDLRIRAVPGAEAEAVRALLAAHGLVVLDDAGSMEGLIRASAPEGADPAELAERLMGDTMIAYVAVDGS